MKKYLLSLVLLLSVVSISQAQEWSLKINYIINNAQTPARSVIFGYDPAAADSMIDNQWSEVLLPALSGPGDPDLRMVNRMLGRGYLQSEGNNGGPVDIRRKPSLDSFTLGFELSIVLPDFTTAARLEWDKSAIPSIIKHIYIISEAGSLSKFQKDMVVDSRLDIPLNQDSAHFFDNILIRVLYNTAELGVSKSSTSSGYTLYPSMGLAETKRFISCPKDTKVSLRITDILGREVSTSSMNISKGINELSSTLTAGLAPGLYVVSIFDESDPTAISSQKIIIE